MKKFNGLKKAAVFMAVLALTGLTGCGGAKEEKATDGSKVAKVAIVQLVEHAALDAANQGFVAGLAEKGFEAGKNVSFDQQNAQADQSNLQTIAQRFMTNKPDVICAIATPAAQTMANATSTIPIVGTAITDYESARLVKSSENPGTNVTGTTDMNPIDKQIELIKTLVPQVQTIGVIYNSSEVNSQLQVEIAKKEAATLGLKTIEATVSTVNDIQQAAQSLIGKVEAIYVPTDNTVASAMPTLAIITNEAKIPVICGEDNVVKAGALATVGINYYKLGVTTGHMAAKILKGEAKPAEMPIEKQGNYELAINLDLAKKLGIVVPEAIKKNVKDVKL